MPIPLCNILHSGCEPDWTAISALVSALAVGSALWLGGNESRRRSKEDVSIAREVCSAAARSVAYLEIAQRILSDPIHYRPQIDSLTVIRQNSSIIEKTLDLLLQRGGLSDGVIAVGLAGRQISKNRRRGLGFVRSGLNQHSISFAQANLNELNDTRKILEARAQGVRRHYGLRASGGANRIKVEYGSMLDACDTALENQTEPPRFDAF